ncbi:MAG TPA: hypothetical protein ENG87_03745, partial [Candidatus Pacearchaeota archaeon]|nr:hypothetical protein [Candidatus Pacearchaeota archaeon]
MTKANLHGHFNPDFSAYWLERFDLTGKNIAQVAAEKCFEKGLEVYAITSEYDNEDNSGRVSDRFQFVLEHAKRLSRPYELHTLGENSFVIAKDVGNKKVIFLNGQSIKVKEKDNLYEILTFGTNKVPNLMGFNETFKYLDGEGLPGIGEHVLCVDHHGIGKQRTEEFAREGKLTAIEHNAQLALPSCPSWTPVVGSYSKQRNQEAKEISKRFGIPFIANDDSNAIEHIGTANIEFNSGFLDTKDDESITKSLINIIKRKDFGTK